MELEEQLKKLIGMYKNDCNNLVYPQPYDEGLCDGIKSVIKDLEELLTLYGENSK